MRCILCTVWLLIKFFVIKMVDVTSNESYLFSVTVIYKAAVLWICKLPPRMTWIDSQCGNQISVRAVGAVTESIGLKLLQCMI